MRGNTEDFLERVGAELPTGCIVRGEAVADHAHGAFSTIHLGLPTAVLYPESTAEVAAILKHANATQTAIVPWGGKSGLVQGTYAQDQVALSLQRINQIEDIDVESGTVTVQAGCPLQTLCEAVEARGALFPLDLGARGSATIGGNIATNAGGNRVIRFGMVRKLVLGLEVVLADGTVLSGMNHLIKNNTGYDLKQLFIGSEGTLGVVTRAVLRLAPLPSSQNTCLAAVDAFDKLPRLLRHMERALGGTLSAFEVMWPDFYRLVTTEPAHGRAALPHGQSYYVLVESLGADQQADGDRFEQALMEAVETGEMADVVIAKNQAERDALWALRDDVGQVLQNYPVFAFDVSLKISDMQAYIDQVQSELAAQWPEHSLMVFGHLGDGNLHVIPGSLPDDSQQTREAVEAIVYGALRSRGGSVSAEHGIGLEKRPYLDWSRTPEELALMHTIKRALDPAGILNPGKVLAPE